MDQRPKRSYLLPLVCIIQHGSAVVSVGVVLCKTTAVAVCGKGVAKLLPAHAVCSVN